MVGTASGSIFKSDLLDPLAKDLFLTPGLGQGEEGRVHHPTDGQLGELVQEVIERHPEAEVQSR